jgi:hypothetical protein
MVLDWTYTTVISATAPLSGLQVAYNIVFREAVEHDPVEAVSRLWTRRTL